MEKKELYQQISAQIEALLYDEHDMIANMANCSACLYQALPDLNWVGFYLYKEEINELVLGPFQGKPACMHIAYGKGVCGICIKERSIQRVEDVHAFPGHIACDADSRSEIVFPIYQNDTFIGVLDIDSPILKRFDEEDEQGLASVVKILEASWRL